MGDDGAQVLERVAQAQQFIPHPFPVKAQAQALASQLAVELVSVAESKGVDRDGGGLSSGHKLGSEGGLSGWGRKQSSGAGHAFNGIPLLCDLVVLIAYKRHSPPNNLRWTIVVICHTPS